MATWKLDEIRRLVKAKYPESKYKKANDLINSIDWKVRAAGYHCAQAVDVMRPFFEHEEFDTLKATKLVLGDSDESRRFNQSVSFRGFNLVAAANTSHSTPEIIAQLAAFLFYEVEPDVHDVSLGRVIRAMPAGAVKESLVGIKNSPEYTYLVGFTNTLKHISLVQPQYNLSFIGSEYHGVEFRSFSYKGVDYPARRDTDLLRDLWALSTKYVEAGIEISAALR